MNDLRRVLYQLARILGDVNALFKGKIGSRLVNKLMGRKLVSMAWLRGCGCMLGVITGAVVVALSWVIFH